LSSTEYIRFFPVIYAGNYQVIKNRYFYTPIRPIMKRFEISYYDTSEQTIVLNDDDYETETYPDKRFEFSFYDLMLNDHLRTAVTSLRIEHTDFEKFRLAIEKYFEWVKIAESNRISLYKHISELDFFSNTTFCNTQLNFRNITLKVSFFVESLFVNNTLTYCLVITLNDCSIMHTESNESDNKFEEIDIEKIYLSKSEVESIYEKIHHEKLTKFETMHENLNDISDLFK